MRRAILIRILAFLLPSAGPGIMPSLAQPADLQFLQTRPERTAYNETTRYDELVGFLEVATAQRSDLFLSTFGYTVEGRSLPLVVYGDVTDASPEAVQASARTVVYLQGDIHAGEVCGKEALLMLVRDLAAGKNTAWADSLVLLIAPIYNADGNERINLYNRPRQNGPLGGMGIRPNAGGLDLNRDHMKARSPEARALIGMFNAYDPDVVVDFHTTNGSQHGYLITYAPPLNPNTAAGIVDYLRQDFLPDVTERIKAESGWDFYYYGNLPFRKSSQQGWYTFDHRPRFNNNYVGLRNRIAILSEAYAYASFRDRIMASKLFAEQIIDYVSNDASRVRRLITETDGTSVVGDSLSLRAQHQRSASQTEILLGRARRVVNPFSGTTVLERVDTTYTRSMFEYGTFSSTENERVPKAYYVPARTESTGENTLRRNATGADAVAAMLDLHGIRYSKSTIAREMDIDVFLIDSTRVSPRKFQDVNERTVFGGYHRESRVLPTGTLVVPMDQPLARLAFYLLEARSDDGLVNWGLLDAYIEDGTTYPIWRSAD